MQEYIRRAKQKSDLERTDLAREKSGIFTGGFVKNPLNGERIPIWVADYVLISYGTGAIMAVPAHDERDFEFAQKFNIPVKRVIIPSESQDPSGRKEIDGNGKENPLLFAAISEDRAFSGQGLEHGIGNDLPFCGEGILVHSGPFNGLSTEVARESIIRRMEEKGLGRRAVKYKLRDWLFSRQRYWGEPIPILWIERFYYDRALAEKKAYFLDQIPGDIISYEKDGMEWCAIPILREQLPLKLPEAKIYLPSDDGESPLARIGEWIDIFVNLQTGETASEMRPGFIPARRETNTMPQWAGSCWYYLRYMSPHYGEGLVDPRAEAYWKSPDFYIGGAEHAVLHLLYARFWHLFLYDIGVLSAAVEPFRKLFHQGIILGSDGSKMSKSRGNVINPDEIIGRYGADSLRLYEMFLGPLEAMKPWNTQGIEGVHRFLKKVWALLIDGEGKVRDFLQNDTLEVDRLFQETIKKVTDDIEFLQFNTAIAQMMIFINFAQKEGISRSTAMAFLQLLAPFAPHIAEELWARLGGEFSIAKAEWPSCDPEKLVVNGKKIILQINGKIRDEIFINGEATQEIVEQMAWQRERFQSFLSGREIVKKIYVPGKVFNVVVR
ncbi:MAG: class I tRNA ligase family protein [Puniceicoccales bacterium]|nr:class I tRNA ligase family protein [Puniceicoccales bacterium]